MSMLNKQKDFESKLKSPYEKTNTALNIIKILEKIELNKIRIKKFNDKFNCF